MFLRLSRSSKCAEVIPSANAKHVQMVNENPVLNEACLVIMPMQTDFCKSQYHVIFSAFHVKDSVLIPVLPNRLLRLAPLNPRWWSLRPLLFSKVSLSGNAMWRAMLKQQLCQKFSYIDQGRRLRDNALYPDNVTRNTPIIPNLHSQSILFEHSSLYVRRHS